MKKEDLKESLDLIRPSEELIGATMQKIKEQQEGRQKVKVPFWNTMNYRWVSGVATCALVLCVGLVTWRQTGGNVTPDYATETQEYRLAEEATDASEEPFAGEETVTDGQPEQKMQRDFPQMDTSYEQWALLRGMVLSCRFLEVSPEDEAQGIKPRAILEFDLQEVVDLTEQWTMEDTDTVSILVDFADDERLNELVNSMGTEISIQVIPIENQEETTCQIADFFIQ